MLGSVAHLAVYELLTKCRCAEEEPPSTKPRALMLQGATACNLQQLIAGTEAQNGYTGP